MASGERPDDTDAILALGNNFAAGPAKAGFPSVTVPGGFIMPDTNPPTNDPPINGKFPQTVTFSGPAFSEPRLIGLALHFEQATHYRVRRRARRRWRATGVGDPNLTARGGRGGEHREASRGQGATTEECRASEEGAAPHRGSIAGQRSSRLPRADNVQTGVAA